MTLRNRIKRLESLAPRWTDPVIEALHAEAAQRLSNHPDGPAIQMELFSIAYEQGFRDLTDLRQKMISNPRACELMSRMAEIAGGLP
jgi:hypothetical protein